MLEEPRLLYNYTLRLKDIPLIHFSLYQIVERIAGVTRHDYAVRLDKICGEKRQLFPLQLAIDPTAEALRTWLERRKAPKHRQFVEKLMLAIEDDSNPLRYVDITHALSLNDAYWITNDLVEHKWEDYNLYHNRFDEVLANVAFTGYSKKVSGVVTTPELTSCGALKKCWSNRASGIYLLKGDDFAPSSDGRSQVTNEYYAAQVAQALDLAYVPYDLEEFCHSDGSREIVSLCKLFTTEDIGYVDAYTYLKYCGCAEPERLLTSLHGQLKVAALCGRESYADMMLFDSIIGNRDRHAGNFGMLRNNNTGEFLHMAPLFDNGFSLLYGAAALDLLPEHYAAYKRSLTGKYLTFGQMAQLFVEKRHLPLLRKLRKFTFARHPHYNIAEGTLTLMEQFVRERAHEAITLYEEKTRGEKFSSN